jgi:hypothetical protein
MRKNLDLLLTERSLHFVRVRTGVDLIAAMESGMLTEVVPEGGVPELPILKNVCAKLAIGLSDQIDQVCDLLGISKRMFIEAALIEALDQAEKVMESEGVHETIEWMQKCEKETGGTMLVGA